MWSKIHVFAERETGGYFGQKKWSWFNFPCVFSVFSVDFIRSHSFFGLYNVLEALRRQTMRHPCISWSTLGCISMNE